MISTELVFGTCAATTVRDASRGSARPDSFLVGSANITRAVLGKPAATKQQVPSPTKPQDDQHDDVFREKLNDDIIADLSADYDESMGDPCVYSNDKSRAMSTHDDHGNPRLRRLLDAYEARAKAMRERHDRWLSERQLQADPAVPRGANAAERASDLSNSSIAAQSTSDPQRRLPDRRVSTDATTPQLSRPSISRRNTADQARKGTQAKGIVESADSATEPSSTATAIPIWAQTRRPSLPTLTTEGLVPLSMTPGTDSYRDTNVQMPVRSATNATYYEAARDPRKRMVG